MPLEPEGMPLEPDGIPLDPEGIEGADEGEPADGDEGPDGMPELDEGMDGCGMLLCVCCELWQAASISADTPSASKVLPGSAPAPPANVCFICDTFLNTVMVTAPRRALLMYRPGRGPIIALAAGGIQSCTQSDKPARWHAPGRRHVLSVAASCCAAS